MANYICTTRTNYFRVTDEEKYKELFDCLTGGEDEIHDFTKTDGNGVVWHGFGSYGLIVYNVPATDEDEDCEGSFDDFIDELQKILPENEAFILFEVGYEKLRYVSGSAIVVTRNRNECLDLRSMAVDKARRMLGKEDFNTKCEY